MLFKDKKLLFLALISVFSSFLLWMVVGMKTVYENFDGMYYGVVARCFYDFTCIRTSFSFPLPLEYYAAHFPLFPLLMRLGSELFPFHLLQSGLATTLLSQVCLAAVFYIILKQKKSKWAFFSSVLLLFFLPRMWVVRSVVSPEPLFLLLIILSLWFFEKRSFFYASVFGALAVLTKSPGILLFFSYSLFALHEAFQKKRLDFSVWPILLIPATLIGLFFFYQLRVDSFWAYFQSGDNIHLQLLPFRVFDSTQSWVGTFWLEDILWTYLICGLGVFLAFRKNKVWGWFGFIYFLTILFVSHRDISRYSLPLVPVVLLGLSELFEQKYIRIALLLIIVPSFFYSINFLAHNTVFLSDWTPFFL